MDSSSVVCIARDYLVAKNSSKRLTTLSAVYGKHNLESETAYIQMVIDQGGPIDPVFINSDKLLDFQIFEEGVPPHSEPYMWLPRVSEARQLVNEAHRLGTSTILTGYGAELSLDPTAMYIADLLRQGQWLSVYREARRWAEAANTNTWTTLLQRGILTHAIPVALRNGVGAFFRGGYGTWPKLKMFSTPPWVSRRFSRSHSMWGKGLEQMRQLSCHPVERSYKLATLKGSRGDWFSWFLAAPLGMRQSHPFLDPRVITFGLALPRHAREIPGVKEPVLQKAMHGVLPEPIRTRRYKRNFNDVYWAGLNKALPFLESMVQNSKVHELELFDMPRLTQVLRQHAIGIGDAMVGSRITASLSVIAWYDQLETNMHRNGNSSETHPPVLLAAQV